MNCSPERTARGDRYMPSEEFCFKEEQRNKVVARGSCKTKEDFIFVRFFFFFFRMISGGGNEPTESLN